MRKFSKDEKRVIEYLKEINEDFEVGDDPIGCLLIIHTVQATIIRAERKRGDELEEQLRGLAQIPGRE